MIEEWKNLIGYEGIYKVSNFGRVKSLSRKLWNGRAYHNSYEKIIKPTKTKNGYFLVSLSKNNKVKKITIHQLVAIAFLNHIPSGYKTVVDHINNNSLDNRLENLQIISQRENSSKDKKSGHSQYVGVTWDKSRNKWKSTIQINGKQKNLGRFNLEFEASEAYQNALKVVV